MQKPKPGEGRDALTLREAALRSGTVEMGRTRLGVSWRLPSGDLSPVYVRPADAPHLRAAEILGSAVPPGPASSFVDDATLADLERIAPLAPGADREALREALADVVRLGRGVAGGAVQPEPTRRQVQAELEGLRAAALELRARLAGLSTEARALLEWGGRPETTGAAESLSATVATIEAGLADADRCGFRGRGAKGDAVGNVLAERLADAFARHVGRPAVNWSHADDANRGAFLAWARRVLDVAGADVGPGVLRDAVRRLRARQ